MITKLRKTLYLLIIITAFMSIGMGSKVKVEQKKESIVWPPPPDEPRIEYLMSISTPDDIGIKKGFFRKLWEFVFGESQDMIAFPYGVTVSASGRLYVTDVGRRVIHSFDPKGNKYRLIDGEKFGGFAWPVGVAVDKEENVYVTDSELNRVLVFSKGGKYLRDIEHKGKIMRPTGIAVDREAGIIYIVDTIGHRIHVYTTEGKYKSSFGENGENDGYFNFPTSIAIGRDGNLYVMDSMNFRVQIFDKAGRFLYKFGELGDTTGTFARPRSIALDVDGHVYVVDALFEAVQIFDKKGRLLLVFGSSGNGPGEFTLPAGICINETDNKIYIADFYNSRVQVFRYISNNNALNNLQQRK